MGSAFCRGRFQSTHPVWGATSRWSCRFCAPPISIHAPRVGCDTPPGRPARPWTCNFNPRTPCGVRPLARATSFPGSPISIHAPRVGCDENAYDQGVVVKISIHAPRVGCDLLLCLPHHPGPHFNPRTPCGVRRYTRGLLPPPEYFNPRTPCGVRHSLVRARYRQNVFQSTHPVWGATTDRGQPPMCPTYFNPRTPCGVRPACRPLPSPER